MDVPWRREFDAARDPYTARNALGITSLGGGGGAPTTAEYITSSADATLTNERVLTNTASITWDFSTPGQAKATSTGGGNVSNSGTPTVGQYAKWVTATTIQGVSAATVLSDIGAAPLASPTFTGDPKAPTPTAGDNDTSIATTAFVTTAITGKADLASPAFTGDPKAPTATAGDNDTSIATTAFVTAAVAAAAGTPTIGPPQGRLTLGTGEPVMTTTHSAATTIYYTPYIGNLVPIYNGANFVMTAVAEISCLTTDTTKNPAAIGASKCNDWYVWNDAGTVRLSHGPDWTNDTTRGGSADHTKVWGIRINAVAITNGPGALRGTYVGTTRSNASSQLDWIIGGLSAGGTAAFLGVWNAYNRVDVVSFSGDTADSWTVASATFIPHAAVQHYFVCGLSEDAFEFCYSALMGASSGYGSVGIGFDNTSVKSGTAGYITASQTESICAIYSAQAPIGHHFGLSLEASAGGTATVFGDAGVPLQTQTGLWFKFRM